MAFHLIANVRIIHTCLCYLVQRHSSLSPFLCNSGYHFCRLRFALRINDIIYSCDNIQGVSRLVDITARGDFLGLCDQKLSYTYVSDFGLIQSYGHF